MLLQSHSCKAHKQNCLCHCKVILVKLTSKFAYFIAKSLFQSTQRKLLMLLQFPYFKGHENSNTVAVSLLFECRCYETSDERCRGR
jgi:hypothetical protein